MSSPAIKITPNFAIFDEIVNVEVSNLPPNAPVTIDCSIIFYKIVYIGYGHFFADNNGIVNAGSFASHGGTWTGIKPMGLFTSMINFKSQHGAPRFVIVGDARKVVTFTVQAWKGHLTTDELQGLHARHAMMQTHRTYPNCGNLFHQQFLCDATVDRTYCHPDVKRIPIRVDHLSYKIRGVLFVPPGSGPFPGILDIASGAGRVEENRPALFARHGFITLALAYFFYEDLPKHHTLFEDMRLFDAAIDWLAGHELVQPGGVGMIGLSLATMPIMTAVVRNAKIASAICINGAFIWPTDGNVTNLYYETRKAEGMSMISAIGTQEFANGMLARKVGGKPNVPRPLLTHSHDNHIMLLFGEGERSILIDEVTDDIIDQWHRSGKKNIRKVIVPGEGHIIEPPYMALCTTTKGTNDGLPEDNWGYMAMPYLIDWGGDHANHEENSVFAWKTILDCFRSTLPSRRENAKL
uniref:Uncharacterized protein n=1 Tax=Plectus sambesii TaxID=2011161 RepID=A0A914X809_9BILA